MGSVSDEILRARSYLSRVAEPASVPVWRLVGRVGPVEAAARIRAQDGLDTPTREATRERHATVDVDADLAAAARHGVRLLVPEGDEWPLIGLAPLEHSGTRRLATYDRSPGAFHASGEPIPPLALWAAGPGDAGSLGWRSAGVVGARTATTYGEHVARSFGADLAEAGITVVSGGAFGIDRAAHEGTLRAGGETVLVSAGGLDGVYPPTHERLFTRVRETGLLLSESPPGVPPRRRRFLTRNRLIASLSCGTVVVEAAERSGALNTARHCVEIGRPLMIVPGPVTSAMSVGCHRALRREDWPAIVVTSADDVLAVVGGTGDLPADPAADGAGTDATAPARSVAVQRRQRLQRILDGLEDRERAVFDGFPSGRSVVADDLVQATGLPVRDVLRSLPPLESAGLVEQDRDGYRIRAGP